MQQADESGQSGNSSDDLDICFGVDQIEHKKKERLSVALTLGILGSVRQNSISSAKFFRLWGNFLDGNILCQKPKIFNS